MSPQYNGRVNKVISSKYSRGRYCSSYFLWETAWGRSDEDKSGRHWHMEMVPTGKPDTKNCLDQKDWAYLLKGQKVLAPVEKKVNLRRTENIFRTNEQWVLSIDQAERTWSSIPEKWCCLKSWSCRVISPSHAKLPSPMHYYLFNSNALKLPINWIHVRSWLFCCSFR